MFRYLIILFILIFTSVNGQLDFESKEEDNLRQKYGLSQAEWEKYKSTGMSQDELEGLIECGITINEYMSKPWISMGVSEYEWKKERCKGLNDRDIKAFNEPGEKDAGPIMAFVLPGSYHFLNKDYKKGFIFSGLFVTSLTLYFTFTGEDVSPKQGTNGTIYDTTNVHYPIFLVLTIADMLASSIFAYRDFHKKNPQYQEQGGIDIDVTPKEARLRYVYKF